MKFKARRPAAGETQVSERYICTAEKPWRKEYGTPVEHPDAVYSGQQMNGWPSGDTQGYKCPHCGLYFEVELPQ